VSNTIFSKDLLIVPINQGNSHWVCGAVDFRSKQTIVYDSLGGGEYGFDETMLK
jgi:sentrin-specific protease 1